MPPGIHGRLFKVNTVLPFAVLAEERGRKALLPVGLAQGTVAAHRVPRVRDVVSHPQPLWRVQLFAAAPLALGDARRGNGRLSGRRRGRVVPRVVAVQTFALAGWMARLPPVWPREAPTGMRR